VSSRWASAPGVTAGSRGASEGRFAFSLNIAWIIHRITISNALRQQRLDPRRNMARPRKSRNAASDSSGSSPAVYTCPECGKEFATRQRLGAHRNRAHGVAGSSRASVRRTAATRSPGRGQATRRGRGPLTSAPASTGVRRQSASSSSRRARPSAASTTSRRRRGVDRDALLNALFPTGLPANAALVAALGAWLEEGERLAKMS